MPINSTKGAVILKTKEAAGFPARLSWIMAALPALPTNRHLTSPVLVEPVRNQLQGVLYVLELIILSILPFDDVI